jgi:hypothetical protein
VTPALDVAELLRRPDAAGVAQVIIRGIAVNAHGVIRATNDVGTCPDPAPANLERLAALLRALDARQLDVEEEGFAELEMPFDSPTQHKRGLQRSGRQADARTRTGDPFITSLPPDTRVGGLEPDSLRFARSRRGQICRVRDIFRDM